MKIEYRCALDAGAVYGDGVRVQSMAFSPDEKRLLVGDYGTRKVHVWDAESGALQKAITVRLEDTTVLEVSPTGRQFAVGGGSGSVWDLEEGKVAFKLGKFGEGIAFSSDGARLAATNGKKLQIWSTETGELLHKVKLPRKGVGHLAFVPGTSLLLVETRDQEWSTPDNRMLTQAELRTVDAESGEATGEATATADSVSILAATARGLFARRIPQPSAKSGLTRGGPADVWDTGLKEHMQIEAPSGPPTMSMRAVSPLADGSVVSLELIDDDPALGVATRPRVVRLWDLARLNVEQVALDPSSFGMPIKMAAGPEGRVAFVSSNDVKLGRLVR